MKRRTILLLTLLLATAASANPIDPTNPPPPSPLYELFLTLGELYLTLLSFLFTAASMLILALFLEIPAAFLYLVLRKKKTTKRVMLSVAAANMVSVPLFYLAVGVSFLAIQLLYGESARHVFLWYPIFAVSVIILECAVVLFEAKIIKSLNREYFTYKDAVKLTFVTNLFSFLAGLLIFSVL